MSKPCSHHTARTCPGHNPPQHLASFSPCTVVVWEKKQSNPEEEKSKSDFAQMGFDTEYDFNNHQIDESLIDTDSETESDQKVIQKNKKTTANQFIKFILKSLMK